MGFEISLLGTYERLYKHHGPQHWWPAGSAFEVMIGAILTQNTAWSNVERAIANLRQQQALDPRRILRVPETRLASWIRPSGYFNIKARRLRNFCRWYLDQGGYDALSRLDTASLRHALLSVNGIGPETADDIVLYAFDRPVFVIDAYTRRLFHRLGLIDGKQGYEALRAVFEQDLRQQMSQRTRSGRIRTLTLVRIFNEYHALIVIHGKDVCRSRPLCRDCCLARHCAYIAEGEYTPGKYN